MDGFEVVKPDAKTDSEKLYRFAFGDRSPSRIRDSHYDWETSRIGLINGEVVTHVAIYEVQMRVGRARVRTACVNLVHTEKGYRMRGLMRQTFEENLRAMRDNGYDMSVIVNGIRNFYDKFGYVFVWPDIVQYVKIEDLPEAPPDVRYKHFKIEHRDELAELYNRENETLTGTAVKPTFLKGSKSPGDGYELVDESGQIVGYVHVTLQEHRNALWHDESAGDPEQILRVVGELAREIGCERVQFYRQPPNSLLGRRLRRMNSEFQARYSDTAVWTAKVIDLKSTFEKVAQELSDRLRHSDMRDWTGDLRIRCEAEQVTLAIERSHIEVLDGRESAHAIEGGQEVTQLILGVDNPIFVLEDSGLTYRGDAKDLAVALFPEQHPLMCNQSA